MQFESMQSCKCKWCDFYLVDAIPHVMWIANLQLSLKSWLHVNLELLDKLVVEQQDTVHLGRLVVARLVVVVVAQQGTDRLDRLVVAQLAVAAVVQLVVAAAVQLVVAAVVQLVVVGIDLDVVGIDLDVVDIGQDIDLVAGLDSSYCVDVADDCSGNRHCLNVGYCLDNNY